MKKIIIAFCLISFLSISNLSAQSNQYKNLLKDYMEAAGTLDNFQSALENMIDMYKTNAVFKDIPASFWKDFEKEFKKIDVDEIIETFMPVYYKYYTEDDLRQLISFYQSPVGIKMKKNTANIMQESMQLGEKWGREIGEKVAAKLQKELEKKN